ncbi:MAG: hypothetical protein WBX01_09645 [Nitrososphaeraceae archaeon]
MTNHPKGSSPPALFGIVIALASVLVITPWFHSDMTLSYGTGGSGGSGGSGGLLVCPSECPDADIDIAEAVEAENATMAGATNQTNTNEVGAYDGDEAEFLSIQNAKSGSISQINATAYTLELGNVSNSTILFSDRPERIEESISTFNFVGNWAAGPNNFAEDAPNDALIVEDAQSGQLEMAIIELFNPVYDTTSNTLTYTIMAENATSIDLPSLDSLF